MPHFSNAFVFTQYACPSTSCIIIGLSGHTLSNISRVGLLFSNTETVHPEPAYTFKSGFFSTNFLIISCISLTLNMSARSISYFACKAVAKCMCASVIFGITVFPFASIIDVLPSFLYFIAPFSSPT